MWKKAFSFVACCAWVLGFGGMGYLFYYGEPQFAVAVIANLAMAFPFVRKCFNEMI